MKRNLRADECESRDDVYDKVKVCIDGNRYVINNFITADKKKANTNTAATDGNLKL